MVQQDQNTWNTIQDQNWICFQWIVNNENKELNENKIEQKNEWEPNNEQHKRTTTINKEQK